MSGPARYSEEEVALILRRAADLQKNAPLPGDARGMTLAEIEQAAGEAGLSRALVRRAATEVASPTVAAPKNNPIIGAPTRLHLETVIEGEFPTERFDILLEVIRGQTHQIGQTSEVGRTLTWIGAPMANMPNSMAVSVAVRDGETRIRINRRMDQAIGGIFGGILGGVGGGVTPMVVLGAAALAGPTAAVAAGIGFFTATFFACRKIYGSHSKTASEQLAQLLDELSRVAKGEIDRQHQALPSAVETLEG